MSEPTACPRQAPEVADAEEILRYYTRVLRDEEEGTSLRIKAAELLARRAAEAESGQPGCVAVAADEEVRQWMV